MTGCCTNGSTAFATSPFFTCDSKATSAVGAAAWAGWALLSTPLRPRWIATTGGSVFSSPTAVDGTLYGFDGRMALANATALGRSGN